jgi:tetratricopeptide (TPR) repeat protein
MALMRDHAMLRIQRLATRQIGRRESCFHQLLVAWLTLTGIAVAQQPATNELSQFDQLLLQARYGEAEAYALRQLRHFEQNSPGDRGSLFRWNWRLGKARLELGKYRDAEPVLAKALEQATDLWPPGHVYTTEQMVTLADLYTEQGRFAEAEKLYTDALARRRRGLKVDSREQAANMQLAIQALESQGQSQLAADLRRVAATVRDNPSRRRR